MKFESLKKYHDPENEFEENLLRETFDLIGQWPECENCKECVVSCELINIDYGSRF